MRRKLISIGGTSTSAESSTSVGGYARNYGDAGQFNTHFVSIEDTINDIISIGKIPNFCTACSQGDVFGKLFEELARTGTLKNFCQLNTIFSFAEYIKQHAMNKGNLKMKLSQYINSLNLSEKAKILVEDNLDKIKGEEKNIVVTPKKQDDIS